jgi:hypothetical protein
MGTKGIPLAMSEGSVTLESLPRPSIPPRQRAKEAHGAWGYIPYRRPTLARRLRLKFLSPPARAIHWFGCVLRQEIRSFLGHMSVRFAKTPWVVDLGLMYQNSNGHLVPNERTIYRNECIQELALRYPWANSVEQILFLEGFDKGEQFARRMDKRESES